jgi:predicted ATPase
LRRIVLTGGPGAGKTALLELIRQTFCEHVIVLPESAGIVFGGGFPRSNKPSSMRAAQRAIFHVQRELEAAAEDSGAALLLCDRGTVDSAAYWIGPEDFWSAVGTTREVELARYDAVIHMGTPTADGGYNYQNPLRTEAPERAAAIDRRIREVWAPHPHRFVVEPQVEFVDKARRALEIVRAQLPACCRADIVSRSGLTAETSRRP